MKNNRPTKDVFNDCNPNELDMVLSVFFPSVGQDVSDKKTITYEASEAASADTLTITYFNSGKIAAVDCSSATILNKIIEVIESDLLQATKKFAHMVIFTSRNIDKEYFRFDDKILIRPIATPIQSKFLKSSYPAILEFQYGGSSNLFIDGLRKTRKSAELVWTLNLLFTFTIIENKFSHNDYYGYIPNETEEPQQLTNTIFRQGYDAVGFKPILEAVRPHLYKDPKITELIGIYPMA